jgi:hypothetical protein
VRKKPLVSYRPFLNGDVLDLVKIWKNHGPDSALTADISIDLFERLVLSKPYFDREGLIVAVEKNCVAGFVHAGFGPNEEESQLDFHRGVISMLLVHNDCKHQEVADDLLQRAELYLNDRGAKEIYAAGFGNVCPFYLGLYGGSQLPGILESDTARSNLFERNNYQRVGRVLISRCDLGGFQTRMDRELLRLRRATQIEYVVEPKSRSWWDACTQGYLPQLQAIARPSGGGPEVVSAIFWDMQTLVPPNASRTMGLSEIRMADSPQHRDTARYLLLETFRYLQRQGIGAVQSQAAEEDATTRELLQAVGLQDNGFGLILKK